MPKHYRNSVIGVGHLHVNKEADRLAITGPCGVTARGTSRAHPDSVNVLEGNAASSESSGFGFEGKSELHALMRDHLA